ncbi:serine O-acetyltransferase [Mastigocoleus testarum]|uniref:serine O-acetyltransferase n=1 Tax=Mastigocoleus testarum TaxID=996925 RepID=UPI00041D8207|nr:serine O-acetyltransferase [Mastigocoleus testarum]
MDKAEKLGKKISFEPIWSDFRIIFERDPAAHNWLEVLFCYPGLHALWLHRIAHWLYECQISFFPRLISHIARFLTGIEIHPGAKIGKGVFIDHGMGVVIGETAIIGEYSLIYQGVTLGGTGKESGKRHPTLGKQTIIGAGAKILGNIHIGDRVRVGASSVVLRNVPSDSTVVGVPGRNISRTQNSPLYPLEHGKLPDLEGKAIISLLERVERAEKQLQSLTLQFQEQELKEQIQQKKSQAKEFKNENSRMKVSKTRTHKPELVTKEPPKCHITTAQKL